MKRLAFVLCMIGSCQLAFVNYALAQETFTQRLVQSIAGQGTVQLRQDADITALVNGTSTKTVKTLSSISRVVPAGSRLVNDTLTSQSSTLIPDTTIATIPLVGGRKVRMNGYRVQVYAGGNSRDAKHRAYQVEARVRQAFPEQPVYTRFVSPRWICHVGDFQTREEALELLRELRKVGGFSEAITVRCKINAFVYE